MAGGFLAEWGYMADLNDNLDGRTALVTGGGRRVGAAVAVGLAERGADVVVHYHSSAAEAGAVVERISATGRRAWAVAGDLLADGGAAELFERAVAVAGPIDILINSASVYDEDTLWDVSGQSLQRNMQIHAMAPLELARALAGQCESGHVINMLDTRMSVYDHKHASYHISKRTLATLTRMLAVELAPGVVVNAVAPGAVLAPEGEGEDYLARVARGNVLGRCGYCGDIVDAVLFLLGSSFITGQIIYVDGGAHMKGRMYD